MAIDTAEGRRRLRDLLHALRRLGATLASVADEQMSRAAGLYRVELRRTASVLALSLAAALLAFASLAFVALTVMVAFWPTHPVAASASIAAAFGALALAAALLIRGRTGTARPPRRD